ncbi:tRNA (N6-threonylcarbamoyladenosine(37)-N6)-methyltransferase TrmO [Pelovirga terrestris]|uniref:tRNA (N6-threonylcarbamoyladenosine(37)-N6)-methyltransferase TrmO n=1 Tax=Pelovirga terrestris TaxID=2771352 RepID=A0A8J6QSG5_9BACT|nr:tRNA (N6-threonylcarbamoyladenosine(37)-N6)-methyltransferase TrmO [Pelovirga terrestris]MBD1400765.1 tRNA (N6-threonylcarbamoyladenosine(37)-N6)-methyltransferase TrmO [Pelovirga terrestris]
MENVSLSPIAVIHSPFKEKFATPRQSGLTPSVRARVEFLPGFSSSESVRGLEGFSHIWLLFIFHQHLDQGWSPTVRPPRLGGNRRVGVFASRSPFRPNPIGLSAVRLLNIDNKAATLTLEIEGADLIDGTPIIDIKPYIPYADSIATAQGGFADSEPQPCLEVIFSATARGKLCDFSEQTPELEALIRDTLSLDPRPAYHHQRDDQRSYGCHLDRYNIRWQVDGAHIIISDIEID